MTNSEKIKKVNEMLIEVIKEHQVESSYRFKGCCLYRCRLLQP
jgi:hypothetical protein